MLSCARRPAAAAVGLPPYPQAALCLSLHHQSQRKEGGALPERRFARGEADAHATCIGRGARTSTPASSYQTSGTSTCRSSWRRSACVQCSARLKRTVPDRQAASGHLVHACTTYYSQSQPGFQISDIKKFRNPLRNEKFPKFRFKFKLNSFFFEKNDMISLEIAAPATFLDGVE
jgi:hypothetical protein